MSERDFMLKPCQHCPFRVDVRPFLRPERAEEIAYAAQNPYAEFHCHKTLGEDEEGETCVEAKSLICAGFLAMQINEAGIATPEGFVWPDNVYADSWEMTSAYEDEANGTWAAP